MHDPIVPYRAGGLRASHPRIHPRTDAILFLVLVALLLVSFCS